MLKLVVDWREKNVVPDVIQGQRIVNGKTEIDIPVYPYPGKTGWDEAGGFKKIDGPRLGVDRISARFIPPAAD